MNHRCVRAALFALISVASTLAQGPRPEKYHSVKVIKIVSYPTVPIFNYTLSADYGASCPTPINVKEGDEVKFAIEGAVLYIIDHEGQTHQCKWTEAIPPPPIPPKKK